MPNLKPMKIKDLLTLKSKPGNKQRRKLKLKKEKHY